MRETFWLRLRASRLLRKLHAVRLFASPMSGLSHLLVPVHGKRKLRVRSGPGKGLLFELNPRWETGMWEGHHELAAQKVLQEKLKPGSIFYDVGANFGFYSLLAARAGAQVFAFEPDFQNAESLERHALLNSLEAKIEIVRAAVFSMSGSILLEPADFERGHGNARVGAAGDPSRATIKVPCTTLDNFAREHAVPEVVKIDVEGAESEVLKGAEELFSNSRPRLICEVHDPLNASFVEAWLKARNYEFRWLDASEEFPRQLLAVPGGEAAP